MSTLTATTPAMPVLNSLEDIREWCHSAKRGDERKVAINGGLTDEDRVSFVLDVNEKRGVGHICIQEDSVVLDPQLATVVRVWCIA